MAKPRDQKRQRKDRTEPAAFTLPERARPLLLPSAVALLVAPHLIPSEAVGPGGTHAMSSMLWCMLLVAWGIVTAFSSRPRVIFSCSDAALLLLVAWHTLSGLLPRDGVVTRGAQNVVWLWISYGISYFLLRQLLLSSVHTRAVVAVMFGLAICLTAHAYYQYFVTMPAVRQELQDHPERLLKENDILDLQSPARRHFEDRVRASEPLATFALTNSLAGFLAPWTVLMLGLVPLLRRTGQPPVVWLLVLAVGILLLGCLLLTKSRTAVLAVIFGGILVGLFGPPARWRLDWRWPAAIGGIGLVLALIAVAVGGLDAKVLSEAPKSVLYRLEYWRASAAMIGDFPLWGCGPGNFQDYYTHYKLPQASETVADPHNLFLEVWATAGTPALVGLLAWMGVLVFDVSRGHAKDETPIDPLIPSDSATSDDEIRRVYLGGFIGVALGFGLAFLTVYPLWSKMSGGHVGILLIGLPLAAVVLWLLRRWVASGPLGMTLPVIGLVTLLINLCAAGAVSFPGVITSALILAACGLEEVPGRPAAWNVPRQVLAPLLLAPLALTAACLWTEYSPVLRQQALLHEVETALEQVRAGKGRVSTVVDRLYDAAAADPANSEPWQQLAAIHLQQWLVTGSDETWEQFSRAAEEWRRLRPARYEQHRQRGEWYLQAHRKSSRDEHLQLARAAYQSAALRSPGSALAHAQLAWVLHRAGDEDSARSEAERALALDAVMPHEEFTLRNSRVTDPQPDAQAAGGWRMQRPETAEQTLANLRTGWVTPP